MKRINRFLAIFAGTVVLSNPAIAQNGTWTNLSDSIWGSATNWLNGIIADGAGNTADFSTLDLTGDRIVELNSSRILGSLVFADTDTSTAANWILRTNLTGGQILTLSGGSRAITVNGMGVGAAAQIDSVVAGTAGLTKAGAGTLQLLVAPTLTGGITVSAGNLSAPTIPVQTVTNSSTLTLTATTAGLGSSTVPGMYVPAGATANLVDVNTGSHFYNGVSGGAGSILNILCQANGMTFSADRNWAWFGSLGTLNLSADPGERWNLRLRSNGGNFDGNSFQNTTVNADAVTIFLNTFSGGSDCRFGALNGTTNSILNGGGAGAFARYIIGQVNGDSKWEGQMNTGNGFNLTKEGTGTLTLSGTNILYQPTANATVARRGGETIINAGTLALTNGAFINRGIVNGTEEIFSQIIVNTNGTFEVTGTTNNSTSPLTLLRGTGKIKGNYVHDEGVLSPNNALVAGTLTFLNDLVITNSPSIDPNTAAPYALVTSNSTLRVDISPSLTSGNDVINVAGQVFVDGNPDLEVNFLGGASAGAYTLINATNGVVGNPSSWNVKWGGRGAAPTVTATANAVQLNVSLGGAANLVWKGGIDNVWNVNTTSNWLNGAVDDKFYQLDNVRFDDSLGVSLQPSIVLNTIVTPASIIVSNDASVNPTYTISGSGQIGGGTSLSKRGSGTLTLTTANTFAGGTTVSDGGTIDIGGTTTALGIGTLTLNNGRFQSTFGSGSVTIATPIVFGASTTNTLQADGAGNTIFSGNFTGPSSSRIVLQSSQSPKGADFDGDKSGFVGTIEFASQMFLRFRSVAAAGTSAIRWEMGDVGAVLGSLGSGTPRTFTLGALSGGANSTLSGHESSGGGLGSDVTWEIGALNLNTTFGGIIRNGNQTGGSNTTSVVKVGTGTLTLTGISTYTGSTTISNGTLSISSAFLAPASTVAIATPGKLDLNFAGTNYVGKLLIDGVQQANGTYGATGSGAVNIDNTHFSGTGVLWVGAPPQPTLATTLSGTQLTLDWPTGQGWHLQAQTNSLDAGLSGNWINVSGAVPPYTVDIDPASPTVFFRLVYP
jgi:autotransporter-associated beta strand protein